MKKRSKFKIPISWAKSLDLAEFPQLIFSVNATIAESTQQLGDDARLKMAFDKLKKQQAQMQKLRLYMRRQDLTKQISEQDNMRKNSLSIILQIVKARGRSYDNEMANHARVLLDWILGVAPNISRCSRNRLTRYFNIIIEDLHNNEKYDEAIDYLNLRFDFDAIIDSNSKYEALKTENDLLFVAKNIPHKEKLELIDEAYGALCNFISTLQTNIEWFGEDQYMELWLALKKNLGDFHTPLKMRRKKKPKTNSNENVATVKANANNFLSTDEADKEIDNADLQSTVDNDNDDDNKLKFVLGH